MKKFNVNPTVSVLMSVYDEPLEWITKAIDSILNQTFTDFEFIIVNDKPERKENQQLLNSYSIMDSRIRIIENTCNLGLPTSLNKGIALAFGKYIARMDADDISLPARLKYQVDYLNSHQEIGVCGTFAKKIDEKGNSIGKFILRYRPEELRDSVIFFCPMIHPTVMFRREVLLENKYDEECKVGQDWNLWFRLSKQVKFSNIRKNLLLYRYHNKQMETKAGGEISLECKKYTDKLFAKEMRLPEDLTIIFQRTRSGGMVSVKDVNKLYSHILNRKCLNSIRIYGMISYLHIIIKKYGISELFFNKILLKHPHILTKAILLEFTRISGL